MVNKRFRVCSYDQPFLLPPSLQDWLPENHLARFIAEVMNELDLSSIYASYERSDGRGLAAYHPTLMARLLLYGYCIGITSSRKIEQATYDNVAFRYLSADQHPDHDTLAAFRQRHHQALADLFVQALRLCQKAGLVKLGNVSIDGTKIKANANAWRSMNYEKLSEREQHWRAEVARLLSQAQQMDREEDQRLGSAQPGERLPDELADAQKRLERLQQAKAELEREAQAQLQEISTNLPPCKPGPPKKGEQTSQPSDSRKQRETNKKRRLRARKNATAPSRRYNFVDPESRLMKGSGQAGLMQAYNAQIAVDSHAQIIVAAELTQQAFDCQQLLPMVKSLCSTVQGVPTTITADAGYWDTQSLLDPSLGGIEMLVPPDSKPQLPGGALSPTAPRHEVAFRMRQVLATEQGKARYALRQSTVEPVFGQIKEARGIRRFRLRGLLKTNSEWKLICATHNLLKLFRHRTNLVLRLTHLAGSIPSALRLLLSLPNRFFAQPNRPAQIQRSAAIMRQVSLRHTVTHCSKCNCQPTGIPEALRPGAHRANIGPVP
jgi:transposase